MWIEILDLKDLDVDNQVPFVLYGGNSTLTVLLIKSLNKELKIDIEKDFFIATQSLNDLIDYCIALKAWQLPDLKHEPTQKIIFYFPPLVGDTFGHYNNLAKNIGANYHHLFFECPLIKETNTVDQDLQKSYEDLVDRKCRNNIVTIEFTARVLANIILKQSSSKIHYIIGYSYGGLLAAATGAELQNIGHSIQYLGLIDSQAPCEQKSLDNAVQNRRLLFCVRAFMKIITDRKIQASIHENIDHQEKELVDTTPRQNIINLMTDLIEKSKSLVDGHNSNTTDKLRKILKTAFYHFLCSYDYEWNQENQALTNVYFFKAMIDETTPPGTSPVSTSNQPWRRFCNAQRFTEYKFDTTHSHILSRQSSVVETIAKQLKQHHAIGAERRTINTRNSQIINRQSQLDAKRLNQRSSSDKLDLISDLPKESSINILANAGQKKLIRGNLGDDLKYLMKTGARSVTLDFSEPVANETKQQPNATRDIQAVKKNAHGSQTATRNDNNKITKKSQAIDSEKNNHAISRTVVVRRTGPKKTSDEQLKKKACIINSC